uniref:Uncharacterized protein n=1 Tax=Clandestinovirus TaxID=2831644 RepID=A0A8F8PK89_9VIRU|nr:hypothetical protein KOM_12_247 [Clandestinovirus]
MALQTSVVKCNQLSTVLGSNTTIQYRPVNVIFYATAAVTASTGGAQGTAYSIPIPAGLVKDSGHGLDILVIGQTAGTANAKSIGVQWGSTAAQTRPFLTSNSGFFEMKFHISRGLSNTNGDFTGILEHADSNRMFGSQDITCSSFDSDQNLNIVYTASAANDVIFRQARVWAYGN